MFLEAGGITAAYRLLQSPTPAPHTLVSATGPLQLRLAPPHPMLPPPGGAKPAPTPAQHLLVPERLGPFLVTPLHSNHVFCLQQHHIQMLPICISHSWSRAKVSSI